MLDDARSYLASKESENGNANFETQISQTSGRLANAPSTNGDPQTVPEQLRFLFSGRDQQSLERNLEAIVQHLGPKSFLGPQSEFEYLQNLAYTLYHRRSRFRVQAEVVASSVTQLVSKIQEQDYARSEGQATTMSRCNQANWNTSTRHRQLLHDLPPYSWDHSRTYWAESRMSREFRLRNQAPRSLIGAPQPSYGENEHIWRGFLRVSEEPWVKDHQVLGAIVYPAAGYLAMAIEAAHDIADKGCTVSRYVFRDVQFHAAAVIKEDVPLELIIQMRPHRAATRSTATTWLEFSISSCHNGRNVRDNCFGLLSIEYEVHQDSHLAQEEAREVTLVLDKHKRTAEECYITQSPKALYEQLASIGLTYGEAFQQISKITKTAGLSSCQVQPYVPLLISAPHVVHPATLDSMIQTIFPALAGSRTGMQVAMLPTLLESLSISPRTLNSAKSFFRGVASAKYSGARDMVADFSMVDYETKRLAVTATGLHCKAISDTAGSTPEQVLNGRRNICFQLTWVPARDVLSVVKSTDGTKALNGISRPAEQDILILEGDHGCATALSDALMSLNTVRGSYIPIPKSLLRASLQDLEGKTCIATLEMGTSFLANATVDEFATFKEIVRRCPRIIWVSSSSEPVGSVITGLARTMRNEDAALVFRTLQLPSQDMYDSVNIAEVVSQLATSSTTASEFVLDQGVLKVSKILGDIKTDSMVASMVSNGGLEISPSTLNQVGTAQKLALPPLGMLENIHFEADEVPDKLLGDDEVEIEVKASGIK